MCRILLRSGRFERHFLYCPSVKSQIKCECKAVSWGEKEHGSLDLSSRAHKDAEDWEECVCGAACLSEAGSG